MHAVLGLALGCWPWELTVQAASWLWRMGRMLAVVGSTTGADFHQWHTPMLGSIWAAPELCSLHPCLRICAKLVTGPRQEAQEPGTGWLYVGTLEQRSRRSSKLRAIISPMARHQSA